ncbi:hypothetical protein GCM10008995_00110 [Halobellus salinus]|uniref:Uncharacterized protein n=1 Tax=Halobellus salinus TaxID=931585 RepID=A0A830ENB5_9EURY|nr:DUF6517 family protein [Halobellus salinus]GGI93921.1 hypothetical protein GCM10008995_00110 [Halobellus salinus]SMP19160.1 hypothetical protein SAMN06265347_10712 [Halobellus salinus]
MTPNRRGAAAVAVVLLLVTSGCIGFLTGSEPLRFSAEPAAVSGSAADEAGYEYNGTRELTINRSVDIGGQERRVVATNRIAGYTKSADLGPLGEADVGVFNIVTTPAVEVAGQTLNPVGSYSNARLVEFVQQQYSGLGDIQRVSQRNVTIQGTETTVTKFSATATIKRQEVDVFVHVTKYRSGDDFVVAIGVYPQQLEASEEPNVLSLLRAIDHPVDA